MDFIKNLNQKLDTIEAHLRNPVTTLAMQTLVPGSREEMAAEYHKVAEAIAEAKLAAMRTNGGDVSNGSLREQIVAFRPVLRLHRDMCTDCEDLIERNWRKTDRFGEELAKEAEEGDEYAAKRDEPTEGNDVPDARSRRTAGIPLGRMRLRSRSVERRVELATGFYKAFKGLIR